MKLTLPDTSLLDWARSNIGDELDTIKAYCDQQEGRCICRKILEIVAALLAVA